MPSKTISNMDKGEKALAKWFLDKEWSEGKKKDNFREYHSTMGWIFCNAFIMEKKSVLDLALKSLEVIKEDSPQAYKNYISRCERDLEELELAVNNIVPFSNIKR